MSDCKESTHPSTVFRVMTNVFSFLPPLLLPLLTLHSPSLCCNLSIMLLAYTAFTHTPPCTLTHLPAHSSSHVHCTNTLPYAPHTCTYPPQPTLPLGTVTHLHTHPPTHPHTVYYSEFALLLLGIPGHFLVVWYLWTGRGSVFNMKLWMVLSLFLPNSALAYVSTSPHSLTLAGVAVSGLALTAAQTPK